VPNDNSVAVQDVASTDYEHQILLATGLVVRPPAGAGKSVKLVAPGRSEYGKVLVGPPGSDVINPVVTAAIRDSKKATVTGKVSKIITNEGALYPPRALEIAVKLDDALIEP
jgi:hypothetical protein